MTLEPVPSSFRDPSGSLFLSGGSICRRVNFSYKEHYDHLIDSGLYDDLKTAGLLISHDEIDLDCAANLGAYKILKPKRVPFISYPYEWCFSQLKDSTLVTLQIQKRALNRGMILKDCSAYNIQFVGGKPVLIDTLSFEKYTEGYPWVPYRQFCQRFLATLASMSNRDVRFNQLIRVNIDGVPLDLAGIVLPFYTRLSFPLLLHIHLHAKSQRHYANKVIDKTKIAPKFGRRSLLGLVDSLESLIGGLRWNPQGTEWASYYQDDSYIPEALNHKKNVVREYLDKIAPRTVWDLGANIGMFSRIACDRGATTISFDIDPACVELNYLESVERGETRILPLILDLSNPSSRIGWANEERMSLIDRGPADAAMALALIHHLAIADNVPLLRAAKFFESICLWLIIEFVPKSDPKVRKLLATREDVFPDYTQQRFEEEFSKVFTIRASLRISNSERTLYLMQRS
jgi:hypothetical protein